MAARKVREGVRVSAVRIAPDLLEEVCRAAEAEGQGREAEVVTRVLRGALQVLGEAHAAAVVLGEQPAAWRRKRFPELLALDLQVLEAMFGLPPVRSICGLAKCTERGEPVILDGAGREVCLANGCR